MAGNNRKAAEDFILKYIDKLLPGSQNKASYEALFANMDDDKFDEFMQSLNDGTRRLAIIAPNLAKVKLSTERNLKIAEELGHDFFERVWMDGGNETPPYLSPMKYLIVDLPLRRQAQLLEKKIRIPEDNKSIDDLTGQPSGKSKGSKLSYPETQMLAAQDLESSLVEMLKYRGGDIKGFNAMNDSISRTGGVSMSSIESLGTKVRSTSSLHILLTGMHLENTL